MPVPVKFDEDLPAEISNLVGAAGHDAKTVHVQGHTGLPDGLMLESSAAFIHTSTCGARRHFLLRRQTFLE